MDKLDYILSYLKEKGYKAYRGYPPGDIRCTHKPSWYHFIFVKVEGGEIHFREHGRGFEFGYPPYPLVVPGTFMDVSMEDPNFFEELEIMLNRC